MITTKIRRIPKDIVFGEKKRELGVWQFYFYYGRDSLMYGRKTLTVAAFRLNEFPEPGEMLQRKNYTGLLFSKTFHHPMTRLRYLLEDLGY